uniref:Neuralized-like protein 2 n=1 Tax=Plectus sambesii TaxID=2011161 RepID=A0A914VW72_9BILA
MYEEVMECSSSLRFHDFHGDNIDLFDDRTRALRRASFANSIAFSARPLEPFEPFLVSIERNENGWSGHMRLGLTSVNPNTRVRLPMYALPELNLIGRSWVFAISRHQFNDHNVNDQLAATTLALPRRSLYESDLCAADANRRKRPLPTDVGSRVGVYFAPTADGQRARLHLLINGDDYCPTLEDIPLTSALYAVVDVYGTTKQVRVVPMVRTVQKLQELCKQTIVNQVHGSAAIPCLPLPDRLKLLLQECD